MGIRPIAKRRSKLRMKLEETSTLTHRPFVEILAALPDDVVIPSLEYPGSMKPLIDVESIDDPALKIALQKRMRP